MLSFSSASGAQRGSPTAISCSCGSRLRFLPHSGQSPAQSSRHRILSGSASTTASCAQAERSRRPSATYGDDELDVALRVLRLILADTRAPRRSRRRRGSESTARAGARGRRDRRAGRSSPRQRQLGRHLPARRGSAGRLARAARARLPALPVAPHRAADGRTSGRRRSSSQPTFRVVRRASGLPGARAGGCDDGRRPLPRGRDDQRDGAEDDGPGRDRPHGERLARGSPSRGRRRRRGSRTRRSTPGDIGTERTSHA